MVHVQLIERIRYFFSIVSCTTGRELNSQETDMRICLSVEFTILPPVALHLRWGFLGVHVFCSVAVEWKWSWSWVAVFSCLRIGTLMPTKG
jgi:hypothetical protein